MEETVIDPAIKRAEMALKESDHDWLRSGRLEIALRSLLSSTSDLAERLAGAERDIATFIESASDAHKRAEAAERERDEARRIAAEHRCVEINPTNCPTCSPLALAWDNPEDAVYDAAPTASRPMTRDEAEAVEEIESAMFTAPPPDAAREAKRRCAAQSGGEAVKTKNVYVFLAINIYGELEAEARTTRAEARRERASWSKCPVSPIVKVAVPLPEVLP